MASLLTILGVLLVIEGIPYFAFPGKAKTWAQAVLEIPDRRLRLMGLVSMMAGLFALYAASISH